MSGVLCPPMSPRITILFVDDEESSAPIRLEDAESRWYRKPRNIAAMGLIVAAGLAALIFVGGRESPSSTSSSSPGASVQSVCASKTLNEYVSENQITQQRVLRGQQGSPTIEMPLPWGWFDAGDDTPEWAYRELLFKWPVNKNDAPNIVFLMSKMTGDVDPSKVLEYSTGELNNLPDYTQLSDPTEGTLSGFDAVQLGGIYRRDGQERFIAQKTVVIPRQDGLYVLQMNIDVPKEDGPGILARATGDIDEQLKIIP